MSKKQTQIRFVDSLDRRKIGMVVVSAAGLGLIATAMLEPWKTVTQVDATRQSPEQGDTVQGKAQGGHAGDLNTGTPRASQDLRTNHAESTPTDSVSATERAAVQPFTHKTPPHEALSPGMPSSLLELPSGARGNGTVLVPSQADVNPRETLRLPDPRQLQHLESGFRSTPGLEHTAKYLEPGLPAAEQAKKQPNDELGKIRQQIGMPAPKEKLDTKLFDPWAQEYDTLVRQEHDKKEQLAREAMRAREHEERRKKNKSAPKEN